MADTAVPLTVLAHMAATRSALTAPPSAPMEVTSYGGHERSYSRSYDAPKRTQGYGHRQQRSAYGGYQQPKSYGQRYPQRRSYNNKW